MSQKFVSSQYLPGINSGPLLLTTNNILQPKRLNTNISGGPNSSPIDGGCRRILGSKGQICASPNGISHLSNQQLTNLLSRSGLPLGESCHQNINLAVGSSVPSTPISSGIGNVVSKSAPSRKQPNTMAKRNARERNRVKQVNQGFQTLRQHIPDSYRMKKMSKVDTLRCALDYIRNMERILQLPDTLMMDSYAVASSPSHSSTMTNLSSSTSIMFSSEEEDLFIQGESPSYHEDHMNLLVSNNGMRNKSNDPCEVSQDPVTSTCAIGDTPATFELGQGNCEGDNGIIVDEPEGSSDRNGIIICPPLTQNGVSAGRNETGDVIRAPSDLDRDIENNDRILIVTTNVDGVPEVLEMRVVPETSPEECCTSSGHEESHGQFSDGYSDIENLDHDDEHKYHF